MDFIKNAMGSGQNSQGQNTQGQNIQNQNFQDPKGSGQSQGGGFFSGIGDKFNSAAGGGRESEKNEDYLDKGVDLVQEHVFGQGKQDNESAFEQAKDEQISDFIRNKYKSTTGSDFPVPDKKH